MNRTLLSLFSLMSFTVAACTTAKDDTGGARAARTPVAYNTVVECILYDGMKKDSPQILALTSGTEVQVTDTVDYYFMKARVTKDGQTYDGYVQRQCFGSN
ncbi:hypothetical protein [Hymenobacter psychrotolerans]|uniref:SH3 domain-containing protein n=1 Tax=Hymenobacter psychrotolerans DSM 18569 TaxID=1121959 RepID=A0A1M7AHS5_9BACT|nr:hypothetical protein [Hymenobacter psychrotolerans]SHL42312.1 hypothetical protein SAMN02746009_02730 [Hymenobacter psychrotolerans DSM 18569]